MKLFINKNLLALKRFHVVARADDALMLLIHRNVCSCDDFSGYLQRREAPRTSNDDARGIVEHAWLTGIGERELDACARLSVQRSYPHSIDRVEGCPGLDRRISAA